MPYFNTQNLITDIHVSIKYSNIYSKWLYCTRTRKSRRVGRKSPYAQARDVTSHSTANAYSIMLWHKTWHHRALQTLIGLCSGTRRDVTEHCKRLLDYAFQVLRCSRQKQFPSHILYLITVHITVVPINLQAVELRRHICNYRFI